MNKTRIMIIEDDMHLAEMFSRMLQQHGYETQVAASVQEGIHYLASFKPDIICLDWHLKDGTGDAFLSHLDKSQLPSVPPVIIVSGNFEQTSLVNFKQYIEMVLVKPILPRELLDHIAYIANNLPLSIHS
jgi:two-component system alkaline phosphatase synthesis response regulator PhoP